MNDNTIPSEFDNLSNKFKKFFVKDNDLPIGVLQEPYFEKLLNTYVHYNEHYGKNDIKKKMKDFVDALEYFDYNEDNFSSYSRKLIDQVINGITSNETYKNLISNELKEFNIVKKVKRNDLYTRANFGKTFLSIDLKSANFFSLKYYSDEIVNNSNSYEDFIRNYTDLEHFINSKQLRQVIFGNLNPKRQIKIQEFIINKIIDLIVSNNILPIENFVTSSSDEIIIDLTNVSFQREIMKDISKLVFDTENKISKFCKFQIFNLEKISDKHSFCRKNILFEVNKNLEIVESQINEYKNVPKTVFSQVFKYNVGMKMYEEDFAFYVKLSDEIDTMLFAKKSIFEEN